MPHIRVIIKYTVPTLAPANSVVLPDGSIDYATPGEIADIPAGALYAAACDDTGRFYEVVAAPPGYVFLNHPAGWNPDTWPSSSSSSSTAPLPI